MAKLMDLDLGPFTGIKFAIGSLQREARTLGDRFRLSDREVTTTHNIES
jgi:hypothetical protein